jgi:hypothetical protein
MISGSMEGEWVVPMGVKVIGFMSSVLAPKRLV